MNQRAGGGTPAPILGTRRMRVESIRLIGKAPTVAYK